MPRNFGVRTRPGSPGMAELPWVSPRAGECLGSLESEFLARKPVATLADAGGAPPSPMEGLAVLVRSDPPVSGHPPPGRRRKSGGCVDRCHFWWALLIIGKSRLPGAQLGEEAVLCATPRPCSAHPLRPGRPRAGSPGGCKPGQALASAAGPRPQPLIGSFAAV